jgi:DNA-binding MarR family transcriptional regulator
MQIESAQGLFIQSPRLNQLNLLREIAGDPGIKQAELARRSLLSVAMVNNYMKELCSLGLLEYHRKSSKTVSYHLTLAGMERLEQLELELTREMTRMFEAALERIREHILSQARLAIKRAVLVGTGNLACLAFHALETLGASILGVCDGTESKIGSDFCGRQVLSPSQIRFIAPDAVIVADPQETEEVRKSLSYLADRGVIVIRLDRTRKPGLSDTPASNPDHGPHEGHSGTASVHSKPDSGNNSNVF